MEGGGVLFGMDSSLKGGSDFLLLNSSLGFNNQFKDTGAKQKKIKFRRGKPGARPLGEKKETERSEKKRDEMDDIKNKLDALGDPYENMDMKTKRTQALHHFYTKLQARIIRALGNFGVDSGHHSAIHSFFLLRNYFIRK